MMAMVWGWHKDHEYLEVYYERWADESYSA